MPFAFHYAARSDVGMVRSNNEDSGYAGPHLLAMADGMGGHAGGDVASSTVIGALVRLDGEALGGRDVSPRPARPHPRRQRRDRRPGARRPQPRRHGHHPDRPAPGRRQDRARPHRRLACVHGARRRGHPDHQGPLLRAEPRRRGADHRRRGADPPAALPGHPGAHRRRTTTSPTSSCARAGSATATSSPPTASPTTSRATPSPRCSPTTADPGETADRLVALALRAGAPDNVTVVVGDLVDIGNGPPTQPQVVGAAAVRADRHPADPDHPGRQGRGAHRAGHRRRPTPTTASPWPRRGRGRGAAPCCGVAALVVVLVVVVAGGSYAVYAWSQRQYYLAEQDGVVAVFRGVEQNLGPISLSSPEYATTIPIDRPADLVPGQPAAGHRGRRPRGGRRPGRRAAAAGHGLPVGPAQRRGLPHRAVDLDHPDAPPRRPTGATPSPDGDVVGHAEPRADGDRRTGDLMSIVSSFTPRKGRNVELALVVGAVGDRAARLPQRRARHLGHDPARHAHPGRRLPRPGDRLPPRAALARLVRRPADAADHHAAQRARAW